MKPFISALFIISLFLFLPTGLGAQPGPGDPGGPPTPVGDPTAVPFDGGLSLIIAAGAGYAIKKKYSARKKEQSLNKQ